MQLKDRINALRQAQTLREVYSIKFPIHVGPIDNIDAFNTAASMYGIYKFAMDGFNGKLTFRGKDGFVDAFAEVMHQVIQAEDDAFYSDLGAKDQRVLTGEGYCNDRTLLSADQIHPDRPYDPNCRVWIASNKYPTHITSHKDTLDIFERSAFASVLDARWSAMQKCTSFLTGIFYGRSYALVENLLAIENERTTVYRKLQEAARPVEQGTITLMSGVTFHHADARVKSGGRVFFRAFGAD